MSLPSQTKSRTSSLPAFRSNCHPSTLALAFTIVICLATTSGCIALSIPSQRFHDPKDHGGLFGDFRRNGAGRLSSGHLPDETAIHEGVAGDGPCNHGRCVGDGHYDGGYEEDEFEANGPNHHKPAEVPWPRYHPLPTRPVFSGYPGI